MISRVVARSMAEVDGSPARRVVTAVALLSRPEVAITFTGCGTAVMAVRAGSGRITVIETRWKPGQTRMTDIALGRSLYMVARFARRSRAVMATVTGPADGSVINIDLGPVAGDMANFATVG